MGFMNWLSGRCFNWVHGNQLIYNTCWEDPRLDRVALQLKPEDVLLTITSAGCNALDYALQGPAKVIAVDLNPRQNALLELKIAGIRRLDFQRFFAIFGRGRLVNFRQTYEQDLRGALSRSAQRYWDRHPNFFEGMGPRPSFYFRGTTGYFAWLMNGYIDRVAGIREPIDAVLEAKTIDEQRKIYEDHALHSAIWRPYIRWFLQRDSALSLLGVPRPQRDQLDRQYNGGIARFIEDMIHFVFTNLPVHDNYFWRVYLTGQYAPHCCPDYLRPENFARLKEGLVDRIEIHNSSVASYLERHQQPISRFVLLDHMDWLSAVHCPWLQQEWQAIVRRATPDARVLWRSAGYSSDFVDRLRVDVAGGSRQIGEMLTYHRQLADELHQLDRVHTYGSFYIADLAA
jgi:S-adenosylmethionine-diacylglycerol 3-amino-3-carboxypropyl transferase